MVETVGLSRSSRRNGKITKVVEANGHEETSKNGPEEDFGEREKQKDRERERERETERERKPAFNSAVKH